MYGFHAETRRIQILNDDGVPLY